MLQELTAEDKHALEKIASKLTTFKKQRRNLIPILQMIQKELAYLPHESLKIAAEHLEIPESEVYGVATFYNQFRFHPPGKHPIEISEGETTPDREFSIERVACVGCCALAPVAIIGETVHAHMAPSKVEGLILRIAIEKEMAEREKQKNESGQE